MVTPLTVSIMLACYRSQEPAKVVGAQVWTSKAAQAFREWLASEKLIAVENGGWIVTERGKAWVERMLATPLPVAVWTFPDD